jgi:2-oxoglutarate ferredoxin oxidoreductase subunit beta
MTTMADLATPVLPNWCPGCGNFPLWLSFKNAAVQNGWDNSNTTIVAGIGCHGHLVNFTKLTSIEGLHGRPIPIAEGIKLANTRLNVFVFTGDGDCLGEGGNHFVHAARRNHNIKIILHDNGLYALTTGQASPLTEHGVKTKSTPGGNPDNPVNPLALAIASGATFVARAYASDTKQLTEIITKANAHQGFAVIDILQPCETYNKILTHQFYQQNTYYLEDSYNPTDKFKAFERAHEFGEKKIPLGIFYVEEKATYESQYEHLNNQPLVDIPLDRKNVEVLFNKYI